MHAINPRWFDDPPAMWAHDLASCLRFRVTSGGVAVYVPIAPDKFRRLDAHAAHALLAVFSGLGVDVAALAAGEAA